MTKANELAVALHGYTGEIGYDAGVLFVPALNTSTGDVQWIKVGSAVPSRFYSASKALGQLSAENE